MSEPDTTTRLRIVWAIRHYFPLLIAFTIAGSVLAFTVVRYNNSSKYRATALVVAKQLTLKQEQLPRFGQAVFESGAVANEVATEFGRGVRASDVIPRRISVVPIPDTVLFQVHGTSRDARDSAKLANSAATAFVKELNRAGVGVGAFAVQDPARVPSDPLSSGPGALTRAVFGALAGLLLGLGLVLLIVMVRRPIASEDEAALVVSVPIVPVVLTHKGRLPKASGIGRLARTIFVNQNEQCAVLATRGSRRVSSEVAGLLAKQVGVRTFEANGVAISERPAVLNGPEVDAGTEVPASIAAADRRVIVVRQGASERVLLAACRQFEPDEIDRIVFVSSRARSRDRSQPSTNVPTAPVVSKVDPTKTRWPSRS